MTSAEKVTAVLFLALILAAGGFWLKSIHRKREVKKRFEPHLEAYLKPPKDQIEYMDQNYRKGKMVVVNADRRKLDPLHFKLPDEARADNPQEAGTAVLIRSKTHKSGSYGFFADAYYVDWDISAVDLSAGPQCARFGYGMSPPSRVRFPFWNRYGGKPSSSILEDLLKLPVK